MKNLLEQTFKRAKETIGSAYWVAYDSQILLAELFDNNPTVVSHNPYLNTKDNFLTKSTLLVAQNLKPVDVKPRQKELEILYNKIKPMLEQDGNPIQWDIHVQNNKFLSAQNYSTRGLSVSPQYQVKTTINRHGEFSFQEDLPTVSKKPYLSKQTHQGLNEPSFHKFIFLHEIGHAAFSKFAKEINTGNTTIDKNLNFIFDNLPEHFSPSISSLQNFNSDNNKDLLMTYNESYAEAFAGFNLLQHHDNKKQAIDVIQRFQSIRETDRHRSNYSLLNHDISTVNNIVLEKNKNGLVQNLSFQDTMKSVNQTAGQSFLNTLINYQGHLKDNINIDDLINSALSVALYKKYEQSNNESLPVNVKKNGLTSQIDKTLDKILNDKKNQADANNLQFVIQPWLHGFSSENIDEGELSLFKISNKLKDELKNNGTLSQLQSSINNIQTELNKLKQDKPVDLNYATFPNDQGKSLRDKHLEDGTACTLNSAKYLFKGISNTKLCDSSASPSEKTLKNIKTITEERNKNAPQNQGINVSINNNTPK